MTLKQKKTEEKLNKMAIFHSQNISCKLNYFKTSCLKIRNYRSQKKTNLKLFFYDFDWSGDLFKSMEINM